MGMISCREAVHRLWAYLDDELDEVDRRTVDEHLERCLRCCGEVAFAREIRTTLATRSRAELPPDVQARLEDFIRHLADPTMTRTTEPLGPGGSGGDHD